MPAPLFNEILEKNQLIKGRLNANQADLEKLYQTLQKDSDRLKRKQIRQEEIIKSTLAKRNEIKLQIKRNSESIQKLGGKTKRSASRVNPHCFRNN